MASSRRQADTATRFQVLLERLKSGEAKKMQAFLVEMDKLLRIRLGATEFQRSRIDAQLAQVAADLRYIRGQAQSELMPDLRGIAEYAAEQFPQAQLWPAEREARALARSLCAEMHSGFTALRSACPMNIEAHLPDVGAVALRDKPAVVVGFGGYPTIPALSAADVAPDESSFAKFVSEGSTSSQTVSATLSAPPSCAASGA